MNYFFSFIIGLLIGSFPTAYIILKQFRNIDITQNGSSNVGALNSYKVSKSKKLGIVVFVIDFLKGVASVVIVKFLLGNEFPILMIALIGAVFGHCFSFWIKFKGGRGLATAAGGALIISIPILGIWIFLWLISYAFRRNIHFANFSATLLSTALGFSIGDVMNKYTTTPASSELEFSILLLLLLSIILVKHFQPIKEYISSNLKTSGN
ncbi:MAG: glycerol-3-phosphate acyltransferase [Bacteroidota bacterium]